MLNQLNLAKWNSFHDSASLLVVTMCQHLLWAWSDRPLWQRQWSWCEAMVQLNPWTLSVQNGLIRCFKTKWGKTNIYKSYKNECKHIAPQTRDRCVVFKPSRCSSLLCVTCVRCPIHDHSKMINLSDVKRYCVVSLWYKRMNKQQAFLNLLTTNNKV